MIGGTVKMFDDARGFGFLARDDGHADEFFHATGLVDQDWTPQPGDAVSFEPGINPRTGRSRAVKVTRR